MIELDSGVNKTSRIPKTKVPSRDNLFKKSAWSDFINSKQVWKAIFLFTLVFNIFY